LESKINSPRSKLYPHAQANLPKAERNSGAYWIERVSESLLDVSVKSITGYRTSFIHHIPLKLPLLSWVVDPSWVIR
jgi:hypothetical protein